MKNINYEYEITTLPLLIMVFDKLLYKLGTTLPTIKEVCPVCKLWPWMLASG